MDKMVCPVTSKVMSRGVRPLNRIPGVDRKKRRLDGDLLHIRDGAQKAVTAAVSCGSCQRDSPRSILCRPDL